MKKILSYSAILIALSYSASSWSQKIVYPWRSTTAIVKVGETFEVWFNASPGQEVNEISLRGPFNNVSVIISDTKTDTWVYDKWSENTCNRKYTVRVPVDTPADRYDLILKTTTGDEISLAAVKVIKEYKKNFYIMHFSDAHRWQSGPTYDTQNIILREISTMVDVANIIDPEMIIETGDNHYQNTLVESSSLARITQYMNGYTNGTDYINGMNNFFAPVFSVPGNHDTPLKNYELEPGYLTVPNWEKGPSIVHNKFYGLQNFNFAYGNSRFMGVNNSWTADTGGGAPGYIPNYKWQLDAANAWLSTVGSGKFRLSFYHAPQASTVPVANSFKLAGNTLHLMLAGHTHTITPSPYMFDGLPTYTTQTSREGTNKAPFNLYKVNDVAGTYETIGNSKAAQQALEIAKDYTSSKLKLTYSMPNNGTSTTNTATIVNKFDFPIAGARVRFVVPKGNPYYVTNGTIKQEFDGTNFRIIDATYDLEPNTTYIVNLFTGIQTDECPNDPNKMVPGICGCGVPEGTCPIPATGIIVSPGKVIINLYTNRQLYATVQPTTATNKAVTWESSDISVVTVNSAGLIYAVSPGTATITGKTVDGNLSASTAITVIPSTTNYQAEDAEFVGPSIATNQTGYNGTGFLDFNSNSEDYIKWNVYVPTTGNYSLNFRYAATSVRPLRLTINGTVISEAVGFPSTTSWNIWGNYTTTQSLKPGNNTIILTATGSSGGNFDELTVTGTLGIIDNTLINENKKVSIFPSPVADGFFTVATDGFKYDTNILIVITNSNGQEVYREKLSDPSLTNINLNGKLSNAVYFVTIETDQSKVVKKLIIKN